MNTGHDLLRAYAQASTEGKLFGGKDGHIRQLEQHIDNLTTELNQLKQQWRDNFVRDFYKQKRKAS